MNPSKEKNSLKNLKKFILNLIFVLYIDHTTNYNSDRTSHFLNTLNTMSQIGLIKEIYIYIDISNPASSKDRGRGKAW